MKLKSIIFFLSVFAVLIKAQDAPEVGHIARFGGGIGFTPTFIFPNYSPLNTKLESIGFPKLSTKPIYSSGGAGYIYFLLKNVRVGAFGYSGNISESNIVNGISNEVQYSISNLGFSIEYTLPFFDGFGVSAGALVGGGSIEIDLYKNSGNYNWNTLFTDVQNGTNNINKKLSVSFLTITPTLNVDIPINRFLFFRLGTGYQFAIGDNWEVDNGISISGVPSDLNGNGFYIQTGIFIGLVTY